MMIKVGDKVKFRSDLKVGERYEGIMWLKRMEPLKYKTVIITSVYRSLDGFCAFNIKGYPFSFAKEMLDRSYGNKQEIHITTDGVATYAVMKQNGKVVKRSEAICSPDDDFSFLTGAKIALERLDQQDSKFVPYLSYKDLTGSEINYGTIGESVSMTLPFGEPLHIGDIVESYNMDSRHSGKGLVVKPIGEEAFVMGLEECFFKNGICKKWQIRKLKSYKELKNCEVIDTVLAITEE